jgi:hypothetical protein
LFLTQSKAFHSIVFTTPLLLDSSSCGYFGIRNQRTKVNGYCNAIQIYIKWLNNVIKTSKKNYNYDFISSKVNSYEIRMIQRLEIKQKKKINESSYLIPISTFVMHVIDYVT